MTKRYLASRALLFCCSSNLHTHGIKDSALRREIAVDHEGHLLFEDDIEALERDASPVDDIKILEKDALVLDGSDKFQLTHAEQAKIPQRNLEKYQSYRRHTVHKSHKDPYDPIEAPSTEVDDRFQKPKNTIHKSIQGAILESENGLGNLAKSIEGNLVKSIEGISDSIWHGSNSTKSDRSSKSITVEGKSADSSHQTESQSYWDLSDGIESKSAMWQGSNRSKSMAASNAERATEKASNSTAGSTAKPTPTEQTKNPVSTGPTKSQRASFGFAMIIAASIGILVLYQIFKSWVGRRSEY